MTGGTAVHGITKGNGLNLRDLDHLVEPTEDYLFRDDGTGSCEAFAGGRTVVRPAPP